MRGPSAGVHCLRASEEKPRVRRGIGTVPTTDARLETGQSFARNQRDHQHEGARAQPAGRRRRHLRLRRPLHPQREG